MNAIGEKIDYDVLKTKVRTMNIVDLHNVVSRSGLMRAGSWGFRKPLIVVKDKIYRFTVSGHHHKGHVYIVLNGMDLFDIYYCSNQGTIKKIVNDVYLEDLIDALDIDVERIKEYQR